MFRRMTEHYHNLSLFKKILISLLIVSIIPLTCMSAVFFSRYMSMETSRCQSEIMNSLQWIENDVAVNIDALRLEGIRISHNGGIVSILTEEGADESSVRYKLQKILYDISLSAKCRSACVVNNNGMIVSNSNSKELYSKMSEMAPKYRDEIQKSGKMYIWGEPFKSDNEWLVPYIRFIYSSDGLAPLGVFIANYSESTLKDITRTELERSSVKADDILVINKGRVISSWDSELMDRDADELIAGIDESGDVLDTRYNGKNCMVIRFQNRLASDWSYVAVVSYREIHAASSGMVLLFLVILAVGLFSILAVSYITSKSISKPLEYLSSVMLKLGNENLNTDLKYPQYRDEVGRMWRSLIDMKEMLRKAQDEAEKTWQQNQRLRFEALKAQVNPHFLYNTFSSVIFLIEDGQPREATEMLKALADLLHISISRTREFITVEEEVGLVRNYLDIQRVRYQNAFKYIIDIDVDIMKLHTVKIILQPVVENAIKYGITARKDGAAFVRVTGWKDGNTLVFEVSDNGNALSDGRMGEVNALLRSEAEAPAGKAGIGLKNVHDRIRYEFPGDDRLGVSLYRHGENTVTRIVTGMTEMTENE